MTGIDTDSTILDAIKATAQARGQGDFNNTLPIVPVEIPSEVIIRCPKVGSNFISGQVCRSCDHFNGVVQAAYNDETPMHWDKKHAISCRYPVERKCSIVMS